MKCLPKSGGLNEQNEKIMRCFDMIREEYTRHQKEQIDREKRLTEARSQLPKGRK